MPFIDDRDVAGPRAYEGKIVIRIIIFNLIYLKEALVVHCPVDKVPYVENCERSKGSGRPKGTFLLKEDVISEVRKFMDYAGTAAHLRRLKIIMKIAQ